MLILISFGNLWIPWPRLQWLRDLNNNFSNFTSLFGDRLYSEDSAIISGFAFLEGRPVLILGTEKGNDMNSRIQHNFGMAKPEGYRKSQRIMKLASKLNDDFVVCWKVML